MRIVVVILVLAIIASLFSGLYFVYKDKGHSNRAVISLTIRIGLSLLVFAILIGGYLMGWVGERGL
jgi:TRAP-type C4-dicarboxylate transport system permease large subunit